jgi:hypothetical protein
VRDDLGPRLETVPSEPPHRQDQVVVGDDLLQPGAAFAARMSDEIAASVGGGGRTP